MFIWTLRASPLVAGPNPTIYRHHIANIHICRVFYFFSSPVSRFIAMKKGKQTVNGEMRVGSARGGGGRGAERERCASQPERRSEERGGERRRDVSCASCHAIHLLSI